MVAARRCARGADFLVVQRADHLRTIARIRSESQGRRFLSDSSLPNATMPSRSGAGGIRRPAGASNTRTALAEPPSHPDLPATDCRREHRTSDGDYGGLSCAGTSQRTKPRRKVGRVNCRPWRISSLRSRGPSPRLASTGRRQVWCMYLDSAGASRIERRTHVSTPLMCGPANGAWPAS